MQDEMTFNQKEAANLLSVTSRTLRAWDDLPDPPPRTQGKRGQPNAYPGRELVAWYLSYRIGQQIGDGDAADPQAAKARLDRLRGDQVEFDLSIKRGDYAPITTLRDVVADFASQVKSIFEGLPKRIKQSMPSLRARELKILERELIKAGDAIAAVRIAFDTSNDSWDGGNDK